MTKSVHAERRHRQLHSTAYQTDASNLQSKEERRTRSIPLKLWSGHVCLCFQLCFLDSQVLYSLRKTSCRSRNQITALDPGYHLLRRRMRATPIPTLLPYTDDRRITHLNPSHQHLFTEAVSTRRQVPVLLQHSAIKPARCYQPALSRPITNHLGTDTAQKTLTWLLVC